MRVYRYLYVANYYGNKAMICQLVKVGSIICNYYTHIFMWLCIYLFNHVDVQNIHVNNNSNKKLKNILVPIDITIIIFSSPCVHMNIRDK